MEGVEGLLDAEVEELLFEEDQNMVALLLLWSFILWVIILVVLLDRGIAWGSMPNTSVLCFDYPLYSLSQRRDKWY